MWKEFTAASLLLAVPLAPLAAQADSVTAEDAIKTAKKAFGPPAPKKKCAATGLEDEIVVCGNEDETDYSGFRVKSSAELDPESREALDDGIPRAPDVAGDGIFKGPATVSGCGLKCPPPPVYLIDFSLLPEAPEGSDADKIAKGEKKAD